MNTDEQFETLDPENWEEMRDLAHRMVDDAISYLKDARERPVWREVPDEIAEHFKSPVPRKPTSPDTVYEQFLEDVFPYPVGNVHPRFWAWYMGSGTIFGALGEFMASIMNPNSKGGNQVSTILEEQVINWIKEMVGFPADASGILVSGSSMAAIIGLTVARNTLAGFDVRVDGLQECTDRMTVYASSEIHSSNQKAIELLGLGSRNFRKIAVKADYTIDLEALKASIAADRQAGYHPLCVIGSAGTINTGAIDDLIAIADLCEQEKIWFHVDGAIGAVGILAQHIKPLLSGMERADSIAMDLLKPAVRLSAIRMHTATHSH
jgi:aromatic-L-amino-acid decarboxylase